MKKLTKQHKLAFELLATLKRKQEEFDNINTLLRNQSDFLSLHACTEDVEAQILKLIDEILGDHELGSYWLYECDPKAEYHVEIEGREYNITTMKRLKDYYIKEVINQENKTPKK